MRVALMEKAKDSPPKDPGAGSAPAPTSSGSRTQWDVIIEIIRLFGSAAPSVVILVGAVYAVMAFHNFEKLNYDQLNKARDDAAKEFREQTKIANEAITTANEAVRKSSTTMAELGKAQVDSLQQTMSLEASARNRMAEAQAAQRALEEQIREKEKQLAQEEQTSKSIAAKLENAQQELANLEKTRDVATRTLAALGMLVDEAPDLLRALATTEGVRSVLSQSTALLDKATLTPGLQYNRVEIALAFADLEGFVGNPHQQRQLAEGALGLIESLRAVDKLNAIGLSDASIDADEALARVFLGAALAEEMDFPRAIDEYKKGIALYEHALSYEAVNSASRSKWQRRQAEAYEQLGRTVDRYRHDQDAAVSDLQQAVDIFDRRRKERPDDWLSVAGLGWARFHIAEVERDHQVFDAAAKQYQLARNNIEEVSDYAHRSNEWLDRMAAIYNASGLLLLDQVSSSLEALDGEEIAERANKFTSNLDEARTYVTRAKLLTEQLVQSDKSNLAWQAANGWSLHNLGAIELELGMIGPTSAKLSESIADLGRALNIRQNLTRQAPGRLGWLMDLRWTQMHLNAAKAHLAEQNGNYPEMVELLEENVKLIGKAIDDDPDSDDWWWHRADNQLLAANARARLNQDDSARQVYAETRIVAVGRRDAAKLASERDRWAQLIKRIDRGFDGHSR